MSGHLGHSADEDRELISRMATGDRSASDEFCLKCRPIILNYLRKFGNHQVSPEDLAQDILVQASQNIGQFRGDSGLKTYVLGIARRTLSKQLKRLPSRGAPISVDQYDVTCAEASNGLSNPESEAYRAELTRDVQEAISQLTPEQAEAIRLFHTEGMSQKEAARCANCSVQALKDRSRRARRRLRKLLSHLEP